MSEAGQAPGPGLLPPGSVIGMLGGGQLGRMTALAAANLGYRVHVLCPENDSPCMQVTDRVTWSSYEDLGALEVFARAVDVATIEFENIPLDAVSFLAERVRVDPSPRALAICQDRLLEKGFIGDRGIATAPFAPVHDADGVDGAVAAVGTPAVLKSARMGYDGKGQRLIGRAPAARGAWDSLRAAPAILEKFIDFRREISVIAARGRNGEAVCFPPVENRHADHILSETIAPAPGMPADLAAQAEGIACQLIEALEIVGVLAVEMFETPDGRLLVNELAPRPHNSGHWTMDGCATSQFEQFVRAICGLPLGPVDVTAAVVMTNLLGDDVKRWPEIVADPAAKLHLYGKQSARPGRKMGHVNRIVRR